LDELYVLTLPSFQWSLIYPASVPNYLGGKAWMSCDIIRDSQMIIMGGQLTNASLPECDVPKIGGQHGLLLGQESTEQGAWWHAVMDNTTGYRVPDNLVALIGGDTEGHATATAPAQGFAARDLSVYFKTTASAAPRTASRFIPATQTATPPSHSKSKSKTGAIAGGVVGGVVGLAAILAIVFLCLRRRRRKQAGPNPPELNRAELANNPAIDPHDPAMSQKNGANYSMHSPIAEAPAYSPQSSSPQNASGTYYELSPDSQNTGDWPHQGGYGQSQPYYPPPADPSQFKHQSPQDARVELPGTATPAIAELPHIASPVPKHARG
jgi:hypothetical protein